MFRRKLTSSPFAGATDRARYIEDNSDIRQGMAIACPSADRGILVAVRLSPYSLGILFVD